MECRTGSRWSRCRHVTSPIHARWWCIRAARVIDGDHDVFGDGGVRLILTPGHTPGHQVPFVQLPKTGPVILSGDLYHFPEELTLKPAEAGRNAELTAPSGAKVQQLIASTARGFGYSTTCAVPSAEKGARLLRLAPNLPHPWRSTFGMGLASAKPLNPVF